MSEEICENSSSETIVPTKLNNTNLSNKKCLQTPRKLATNSNGIFRQRTFESSKTIDRSSYLNKRSNTTVDLKKIDFSAESSKISVNNIHFTSFAKQIKQCESSAHTVHKLGTIPKYLRKTTSYTIQSNFDLKRKQFAIEKAKFYEQQKYVLEQYRRLVDVQKTLNQQTIKQHTKLEDLKIIAYDVKGFNFCLCMGQENYEKIELAMNSIDEILNELSISDDESEVYYYVYYL